MTIALALPPRVYRTVCAVSIATIAAFSASPARAGEGGWRGPEAGQVRLVSAGVADGRAPFWAGLDFRLKPGWKIYWRRPGPAGRPPVVTPLETPGIVVGALHWPRPSLFRFAGIDTVGYKRAVLLPMRLQPAGLAPKGGQEARSITLVVRYQVCRHICIPARVRLALAGAALNRPDPAVARRLAAALAAQPGPLPAVSATRLSPRLWSVTVAAPAGAAWRVPRLVVAAGRTTLVGIPPTSSTARNATFRVEAPARLRRIQLLVLDGKRAVAGSVRLP